MSGPVGDLFECTGLSQNFRFENTNRYRRSVPSRSMGLMSGALRSSAVTRVRVKCAHWHMPVMSQTFSRAVLPKGCVVAVSQEDRPVTSGTPDCLASAAPESLRRTDVQSSSKISPSLAQLLTGNTPTNREALRAHRRIRRSRKGGAGCVGLGRCALGYN